MRNWSASHTEIDKTRLLGSESRVSIIVNVALGCPEPEFCFISPSKTAPQIKWLAVHFFSAVPCGRSWIWQTVVDRRNAEYHFIRLTARPIPHKMNFKSFLSTWKAVFLGGWRGVSILTSQKSLPASWWIIILKTTIITFTPIPLAFSCTTWQASSGRTIAAPTSQQSWSHSHRLVWSKCLDKVVPK